MPTTVDKRERERAEAGLLRALRYLRGEAL